MAAHNHEYRRYIVHTANGDHIEWAFSPRQAREIVERKTFYRERVEAVEPM